MSTTSPPPFHLAIPVNDLTAARSFYLDILGCTEGRSSDSWVDFNFFGHQLVCHQVPDADHASDSNNRKNMVDGMSVPIPHFGLVLNKNQWQTLTQQLKDSGVVFTVSQEERFAGKPGEQATVFVKDPAGNALEFKCLANPDELFKQ